MTEPDDQKHRSWPLLLFGFAPMLYVLSIGPAVWLQRHGYLNGPATWLYSVIYYPLSLMVLSIPGCRAVIEWYIAFWVD